MAKVIGVIGESGAGKTTSLRNLDPATTFYIDCDEKRIELERLEKAIQHGGKSAQLFPDRQSINRKRSSREIE